MWRADECGELTNLTNVANDQESVPKSREAQNAERRQLARDRRDLPKLEQQVMEPYHPRIALAPAGRKEAGELRGQKPYAGKME